MLNTKILENKRDQRYKYKWDSDYHGYAYRIEGTRDKKVTLPAKGSLGITMKYLVIQVKATASENVTVVLRFGDDKANHINITFSTISTEKKEKSNVGLSRPVSSPKTCAMVNMELPKDRWVAVYFDLKLIVAQHWCSSSGFHFLDSIEILPTCSIGKIFAQDNTPVRGEDNEIICTKGFEFPTVVDYTTMMVPPESVCDRIQVGRDRKSGIPVPTRGNVRRSGPVLPKHSNLPSRVSTVPKTTRKPKQEIIYEEEDSDDDDAFGGKPASAISEIEINHALPDNEEEELELVYIEALGCYYCPSNQQYYRLSD